MEENSQNVLKILEDEFAQKINFENVNEGLGTFNSSPVKFKVNYSNDTLQLTVFNDDIKDSLGHKLAVLGDLCKALTKEFQKEPTLFYTSIRENYFVNLVWAFKKENEIINYFKEELRNGKIDILRVMRENINNKSMREEFLNSFGLPIELLSLINMDYENYMSNIKNINSSKKSI